MQHEPTISQKEKKKEKKKAKKLLIYLKQALETWNTLCEEIL